jgi:16S rRNA (uracil1498-N3)-methyltransferase
MTSAPRTRLYLDGPLGPDKSLSLKREQAHYLMNVLRLDTGARVLVFNGRDGEFEAEVTAEGRKDATVTLHGQTKPQPELPALMLAFAPVKKARIDFIAEKATELGVGVIQPVITAFTNVSRVNTARLEANAIEAAEQTGRLTIPEIREPVSIEAFLKDLDPKFHLIFCDEGLASAGDRAMIDEVENLSGAAAVLIGPEGGFSADERGLIMAHGRSHAVSLGPNVLRADTAMVAAITLWQAAAGDWKENTHV